MSEQMAAMVEFLEAMLERVNALEARLIASDILLTTVILRSPDRSGLLEQAAKVLQMTFDESSDPAIRQAALGRLQQMLAVLQPDEPG